MRTTTLLIALMIFGTVSLVALPEAAAGGIVCDNIWGPLDQCLRDANDRAHVAIDCMLGGSCG